MPGLPSAYMKNLSKYGGMKGAWAAFRASKGGGSSSSSPAKKSSGGTSVAIFKSKPGATYMQKILPVGGAMAMGVVGAGTTAAAVRFTPVVNTLPSWARGSIQIGFGIAAMLTPWRPVQFAGMGAGIIGLGGIAHSLFNIETMAGPRSFTAAELAAAQQGILSGPASFMNGPASFMNGGDAFAQAQDVMFANEGWGDRD